MSTESVTTPHPNMTIVDSGIESGIHWVTCRAPIFAAVNGYALIPEGHPWHGLDYDEVSDKGVEVHGGLTYDNENGWVGFDTCHAGDHWPGGYAIDRKSYGRDWTEEDVAEEARSLARQIAASA